MITRRKLGLVLISLLLLTSLTACSGGSFDIQGSWKTVGGSGFGQASQGAIIRFANGQANLYSPQDTYAFYKEGSDNLLEVTGIFGGTTTFRVDIISNNKIELYLGGESSPRVILERVG